MGKWTGLERRITAEAAEAVPLSERLFGPSYDVRREQRNARRRSGGLNRATYEPWKKPRIERVKR